MTKLYNTPTYNAFVKFMYDDGKTDWNPDEHADWELPPSWLVKLYFKIFPLDDIDVETITDKVTPANAKRIKARTGTEASQ